MPQVYFAKLGEKMFSKSLLIAALAALFIGGSHSTAKADEADTQIGAGILFAQADDPKICKASRRTSKLANAVSQNCRNAFARFVWKKACTGRICSDPLKRDCYKHLNDHEYQGLLTFIKDCRCAYACPSDY